MSTSVTVTLPDDVLARAETLARRVGRPVEAVLADTIELSLRPLGANGEPPVGEWSDEQVLAAADAGLPSAADERLTRLLESQQAGRLTSPEQAELTALMQLYQDGLLRKARAVREAVRRGLREPPGP
jgi:predicted transcriptional regulator